MKIRFKLKILLLAFIGLVTIEAQVQAGLSDRAFATHNVGKLGYFTTNIGQFYPYGGQFEKTLEYPINSGHIAMYRQCLMIGVPVNVISAADGRFEEFDAVGGYNAGKAEIAMSDKPNTWPAQGWPVKDENGNPVFVSQQDSYCVYSDSTNWRWYNNDEEDMFLNMRVHQHIWSWGVPDAEKFVLLKFEIENASNEPYEDMFFNFYSDLDIGGNGNADREWADDCIDFHKERDLVYFYDADNYSNEWGIPDPFPSGVMFLKTPNDQGITDWHWIDVTVDEVAVNNAVWDSVSYYLMRSDTTFFHNNPDFQVKDYFHLGDNPINGTRYDDPETTRIRDEDGNLVGGAMVAYICNGPFDVQPGERAEFIIATLVGDNTDDLVSVADKIREHYDNGFNIAVIPSPTLNATSGDRQNRLSWSNQLDVEYENPLLPTPVNDLAGYKLYRTTDPTLSSWELIADIPMQFKNASSIDQQAYEYIDNDVLNGFRYFYNLSAYKTTQTGQLLESARLADLDNIENQSNARAVQPETLPGASDQDLDLIKVVPNPYVISAAWDESRLGNSPFGEPVRNIAFTHVPSPATIKIFTVDGDLVQTLEHTEGTGRLEWNLLTSERRPIVSGVYFYHVESKYGEKIGRFAVIR